MVKTGLYSTTLFVNLLSANAFADVVKKTDVSLSGYIKLDAMVSQYDSGTLPSGSVGRDFYVPSLTPTTGNKETIQFDSHIRQSRLRLTSQTATQDAEKITGVLEVDFQVAAGNGVNERISNSYQPRIRHAFFQYKNWLLGQTWTTWQDVGSLPESVDFIGITDGVIFNRQAMVRYTHGNFAIAAENPESTITPNGGGARIVSDDNSVPDITFKYKHPYDWGYLFLGGIVRQLAYINQQAGSVIDSTETAYGLNFTGKVLVGKNDVKFMLNSGSGLGRYSALNAVNAGVLDANGNIETIDSTGFGISYRHFWSSQLRSSVIYSSFNADNDILLTGPAALTKTQSTRVNLIYNPVKAIKYGVELTFAERENEDGSDGSLNRLQFMGQYSF